MLRNHCWWTWRLFVAFLFLSFFYSPAARGGPLFGLPPLKPGIPPGPPSPTYPAPSTYTISGYVFIDSAQNGVRLPSSPGISAVQMRLTDVNKAITYMAYTNSAGYYTFGSLTPGDTYTLQEMQPARFTDTLNTVGYFLSSTGGTLAAPPGSSNGTLVPLNTIANIGLPLPTGAFAPNTMGGKYAAVNYLFGESAPKPPLPPGGGTGTSPAILSTSLTIVGTNNRFLAGVGAGNLSLTGTVKNSANPGSSNLNWQISSLSSGMSFTPPTNGTGLSGGNTTILHGAISGTNLSSGTQTATLTVSGTSSPSTPLPPSTKTVVINPVFSRVIDSVTTADFGRLMLNGTASSNLTVTSAGSHYNYSDLTMNVGSMSVSDSNGTAIGTNSTAMTFNGTNTTNSGVSVIAKLTTLGSINGTMAIPGNTGLFTGEVLASGTPVLPTLNVPYKATVLEQRQLLAPATPFNLPAATGGLLSGALVPMPTAYSVTSTNSNADSNHATIVTVSGTAEALYTMDGTTPYDSNSPNPPPSYIPVGQVIVTQPTLVNSSGPTTVPVAVRVINYGQYSGLANLNVTTAENGGHGLVGEGTYAPVALAYNVSNVGYAATGGADPANANRQLFGAPLSAPISAGSTLATFVVGGTNNVTLNSIVASAGTAGSNSTTNYPDGTTLNVYGNVAPSSGNYHGAVGSQADILASTVLTSSANVTMAWRNRDNAENGSFTDPVGAEKLPAGIKWLTSDVVNIAGIPNQLTFAMQMTFDDGINAFIEPSQTTTMADSYIGKMVNGKWVNAAENILPGSRGSLAQSGFAGSLSSFLAAHYNGSNLADLAGSWGADLNNPSGLEYSWAIVNGGGGEFAVVPEPSTLALLGAAFAGLLVYRVRRKAQNKSLAV